MTDQPVVDAITALKADIGALQAGSAGSPVAVTAATLALNAASHAGRLVVLDRAGGIAVTLPAATGSGAVYKLFVKTTFTSSATVKVANSTDIMQGLAISVGAAGATTSWTAGATDDTVTLNGTTTGGLVGAQITLEDAVSAGVWVVRVTGSITGTAATPFSSTV
jgi:hypothetical protein